MPAKNYLSDAQKKQSVLCQKSCDNAQRDSRRKRDLSLFGLADERENNTQNDRHADCYARSLYAQEKHKAHGKLGRAVTDLDALHLSDDRSGNDHNQSYAGRSDKALDSVALDIVPEADRKDPDNKDRDQKTIGNNAGIPVCKRQSQEEHFEHKRCNCNCIDGAVKCECSGKQKSKQDLEDKVSGRDL